MDSTESRTRSATAGLSGGEDTENREKLVHRGSHSDYRCGDCCGHSAVKSGWGMTYEAMREGCGISMHRPLAGHTPLRRCGKNPSARRCSHGSCGVVEGEAERPTSGACPAPRPSPCGRGIGHRSPQQCRHLERRGIRLRRDSWVSVMYAEELNSTTSSVTLQSTDRHEILVRQVALKRK